MTNFSSVLAWLTTPGVLCEGTPERIDTHGAVVLLTPHEAWKLKRPVRFSYLDFSTPQRRQQMLQRELHLNQSLAPGLYLGVLPITQAADGTLAFDGEGEVVDWALRMRRFPAEQLLSLRVQSGRFSLADAALVGTKVAQMHRQLPALAVADGAARMAAVWQNLLAGLRSLQAAGPAASAQLPLAQAQADDASQGALHRVLEPLQQRLQTWQARYAGLLQARADAGWVRRCHGDLHLGNLVWLNDAPVPFDALEFDEALATTDVWYDIAFLLMDLLRQGKPREAGVVRDRYLLAMDHPEAWQGLALLPGFMAIRSLVRALVSLQKAQQIFEPEASGLAHQEAADYLGLALRLLAPVAPHLLAVGGLSGSGKSTVAAVLAPLFAPLPGAVHLRTDLIRKQRWGCPETERLPEAAYRAEASAAVYEHLWQQAGLALRAGCSVVLDAVHLRPGERERSAALAAAHGVPFQGFWLEAPQALLEARVAARQHDASDADVAVVQRQAVCDPGPIRWQRTTSAAVLADPARFIR